VPTLANPRYEAFAQPRAKGAFLDDACERAGFVLHNGHPRRLAGRAEVADCIAEIRDLQMMEEDHSPAAMLDITRLHREAKYERSDDRKEIAKDYNYSNRGRAKENETDYP
jgi:hypothetical protein